MTSEKPNTVPFGSSILDETVLGKVDTIDLNSIEVKLVRVVDAKTALIRIRITTDNPWYDAEETANAGPDDAPEPQHEIILDKEVLIRVGDSINIA